MFGEKKLRELGKKPGKWAATKIKDMREESKERKFLANVEKVNYKHKVTELRRQYARERGQQQAKEKAREYLNKPRGGLLGKMVMGYEAQREREHKGFLKGKTYYAGRYRARSEHAQRKKRSKAERGFLRSQGRQDFGLGMQPVGKNHPFYFEPQMPKTAKGSDPFLGDFARHNPVFQDLLGTKKRRRK